MKRSKKIFVLIMTFLMIAVPAFAAKVDSTRVYDELREENVEPATTTVAYLSGGQKALEDIGKIYIEPEDGNLFRVTILLRPEYPDWNIEEVHFEAINDENNGYPGDLDFISSSGGLIPGKFTVNKEFDEPTRGYSFLYYSSCDNERDVVGFAVHVVVSNGDITETAWSDCLNSDPYDGGNWSEIIWLPFEDI